MKIYNNPDKNTWAEITARPQLELSYLESSVRNILKRVLDSGNVALRDLTYQFDKVMLNELEVSVDEFAVAETRVEENLKSAIQLAADNIRKFHAAQVISTTPIETMPGVKCWRKAMPIERIGIYIPGGSAPLFSTVLMLGVPASLAGCGEVVLCTPPDAKGNIHPGVLYAAKLVGIKKVFKVGGAQAIAALAYGTDTIPKVFKIFGPGNQYVTKAKQIVMEEGIAIDIPAGPSEVLVLADDTADPAFVAADLLSQAEHGPDSQVVLVSIGDNVVTGVQRELEAQLATLPRKSIAEKSIAHSLIVSFDELETALQFINEYAPEHLIINAKKPGEIGERIANSGSVFLGGFSPEAVGDYASGTNHTLPTNGYARAFSGVSLESFMKHITFQEISERGLKNIGPAVQAMAEAENLVGHKRAVEVRLNKLS
jgi:histidinol dehydrogenase